VTNDPWDDEDLRPSGAYVVFSKPGDSVEGKVVHIGKHLFPATKDQPEKLSPKLDIEEDDGTLRTLTAGQAQLSAKLREHRPQVGQRLKVVYTKEEDRGGGRRLKHFDVTVTGSPVDDDGVPF
jgi:hypothetical protein